VRACAAGLGRLVGALHGGSCCCREWGRRDTGPGMASRSLSRGDLPIGPSRSRRLPTLRMLAKGAAKQPVHCPRGSMPTQACNQRLDGVPENPQLQQESPLRSNTCTRNGALPGGLTAGTELWITALPWRRSVAPGNHRTRDFHTP
jgi:hypothetical protein